MHSHNLQRLCTTHCLRKNAYVWPRSRTYSGLIATWKQRGRQRTPDAPYKIDEGYSFMIVSIVCKEKIECMRGVALFLVGSLSRVLNDLVQFNPAWYAIRRRLCTPQGSGRRPCPSWSCQRSRCHRKTIPNHKDGCRFASSHGSCQ